MSYKVDKPSDKDWNVVLIIFILIIFFIGYSIGTIMKEDVNDIENKAYNVEIKRLNIGLSNTTKELQKLRDKYEQSRTF